MKSLFRITGLVCTVILLFTACKKAVPKQVKFIPKDASFVIGLNTQSLQEKLAKSQISLDSLVKTVLSSNEAPDALKNWDNLKSAGIDWTATPFAFVQTKSTIMTGASTLLGAVAVLKDAAQFEAYIKKQFPTAVIKKNSNYNAAILKDGSAAGWNNDVVVLAYTTGGFHNYADSGSSSASTDSSQASQAEQQLTTLFSLKAEESAASVEPFRNLLSEKADALFWQNSSANFAAIPFVGMTKAADLLKDAYSLGTLNFEDGKAVASFRFYTSQALGDILKKYAGPTLDLSMVEKYPSDNIAGFTAFSFNPKILVDILQYSGLDAMINQFLTKMGFNFTLADAANAFKGDFAVICSDIVKNQETIALSGGSPVAINKPSAKVLFNAKVGDKAAYDKVTSQLAAKGILRQQDNLFVPAEDLGMGKARIDDKNILFSTDSSLLEQYRAGIGKAGIQADIKDKVKGKAFGLYIDITKFIQAFPSHDSTLTMLSQQTFKDLVITSDNFDGKNFKGTMELRTGNDKENSLASILKFSAAVSKSKQTAAVIQDHTATDSAANVILTDPVKAPK